MRSTALLLADHKHILRALNVLEHMASMTHRGKQVDRQDVADIVEFLQNFADRHHQGKEEGVFFPALLRDRAQEHYQDLCGLIFEHNRDRSLMEGLEESVLTRKSDDFVYYASRLIEILREHIKKEDEALFALADSVLSGPEDDRVCVEMQNYERSWQDKTLKGLMNRLDELERKYLRGVHAGTATA